MSRCAADLRAAARACQSLAPVANAVLTDVGGRRGLELTVDATACVPVALQQTLSAHSLRIDADHSGTRAGAALAVVAR